MIDVVVTWVDGDDPVHRRGREEALVKAGLHRAGLSNGEQETRFVNSGEIYYCIASILKYAPFVRRIFIVTDRQVPPRIQDFAASGICAPDRIRIVDHRTIFAGYAQYLPTYNSLTIESMLWRIPGLSENFLYFNDDCFLNAPLSLSDFVNGEGRQIIRGRMRSVYPLVLKRRFRQFRHRIGMSGRPGAHFKTAQVLSARLFGLSQYIQVGHTPHFLRRYAFAEFFRDNPEVLEAQLSPKFRTVDQFLPAGLSYHRELAAGNVDLRPLDDRAYLKPRSEDWISGRILEDEEVLFGCVQSLEKFSRDARRAFRRIMRDKFEGFLPESVSGWLEVLDSRMESRKEIPGAAASFARAAV